MKNKVFTEIKIERVAAEGKCVTHIKGHAVFVNHAAPDDIVDIKITKNRKSYLEGKIIKYHRLSGLRTDPFCEHFGLCGGCKWQHLDYEHQVEAKRQQVIDHFERIGKLNFPNVNPIIKSENTEFYRNKLEFTFSNKRWLSKEEIASGAEINRNGIGFHIPRQFDKIVDINKCYLQKDPSNKIRNAVRQFALKHGLSFYNISEQQGLLRNLLIRTTSEDHSMVIVQFGEDDQANIKLTMDFINSEFPDLQSLYFVVNTKKNETFHDLDLVLYHGQEFIEERIGDLSFKIGPKSFFQTNTQQAQKLYEKTLHMARLAGNETVYDLYTGTGTIACFIAKHAQRVLGIEVIKEAIDDARENAKINNISNVFFKAGDIKEKLDDQTFSDFGRPDVVITDPPRAGMHADVINTIIESKPNRIVYISCNPATQARDLQQLTQAYLIEEIQPFDMFPHTHHLENIVALKLDK